MFSYANNQIFIFTLSQADNFLKFFRMGDFFQKICNMEGIFQPVN